MHFGKILFNCIFTPLVGWKMGLYKVFLKGLEYKYVTNINYNTFEIKKNSIKNRALLVLLYYNNYN